MVNDICELILLEKQEEIAEPFAHEVVTDIIHDIISNVLDNVPNEIGVEPIIPPTSEILIEATEVSVELELTESFSHGIVTHIIHDIIGDVLDDVQKDVGVEPIITPTKLRFSCIDCGYSCARNSHLLKHFASIKHLTRNHILEVDLDCKHQCKACNKKYKGLSGLWLHNKKCIQARPNTSLTEPSTIFDIRNDIKGLTEIVIGLVNSKK